MPGISSHLRGIRARDKGDRAAERAANIIEGRRLVQAARIGRTGGTLAREASPFPLATKSVWLSGLTATAVGYQPTGMKPSTTDTDSRCFRASSEMLFEISTTTTQLLSALATKSVRPSGETATPSGVLPSGDSGYSEVEIISRVLSGRRRVGLASGSAVSAVRVWMT